MLGLINLSDKDNEQSIDELIHLNLIKSHEVFDEDSIDMFIVIEDLLKHQFNYFEINAALNIHAHLIIVFPKDNGLHFMNY